MDEAPVTGAFPQSVFRPSAALLPSIVQLFVVWHPADHAGASIATEFHRHFQGGPFTGIHDGAIEVFVRCAGWPGRDNAPLRISLPSEDGPKGSASPEYTAIVPLLGRGMAAAIQSGSDVWRRYMADIAEASDHPSGRVGVYPMLLDNRAVQGTELGRMFNHIQRIGDRAAEDPLPVAARCRDLAQALAHLIGEFPGGRLKVFISYTNHSSGNERSDIWSLIQEVKAIIRDTRLTYFLDTEDLQAGERWADDLRRSSQTGAFLALRTDLYAQSAWCQLEFSSAKRAGVPIVVLDARGSRELRGSFLMDNVPRVTIGTVDGRWNREDIWRGLNHLVDECLKHALWVRQCRLFEAANPDLNINWWSTHAPEPATLLPILQSECAKGTPSEPVSLRVVHPGPELEEPERAVLDEMASLACAASLDLLTPTSLASRGGLSQSAGELLPRDSLRGMNVGLSVSTSTDLARLGLLEDHFKAALAELTTTVLKAQGNIIYSGRFRPEGYLTFVGSQSDRSRHLDQPFHVCLAWQEHRSLSLTDLRQFEGELSNFATMVCLDMQGNEIPVDFDRGEDPKPVVDQAVRQNALSNMRIYMRERESARVLVAGQRLKFQGITAGLVEEAYLALTVGQPIYLVAGFGGVTADIAFVLGYDTGQLALGKAERSREPRLDQWLERLAELARRPDWTGLGNGLTFEENLELVGSRRPGDIGALICLGLSRLGRRPNIDPWAASDLD